jgi:hypothetical protein
MTGITDAAFRSFDHLPKIEFLEVSAANVSAEAVKMFQQTHPKCTIEAYGIRGESHPKGLGMSSSITDWYDLSDEEKSQVASQIYSPIVTCQMSSRQDLHEKIDVSVDHRAARIDARLASTAMIGHSAMANRGEADHPGRHRSLAGRSNGGGPPPPPGRRD